ncbi:hypothetical protein K501DRAFT_275529 [Backusella circina FSU 941]|nr:hypothetical protein K501DRAFT_275529 [Backusella circina FSU 941]
MNLKLKAMNQLYTRQMRSCFWKHQATPVTVITQKVALIITKAYLVLYQCLSYCRQLLFWISRDFQECEGFFFVHACLIDETAKNLTTLKQEHMKVVCKNTLTSSLPNDNLSTAISCSMLKLTEGEVVNNAQNN